MEKISIWRKRVFIYQPNHPCSNNRGYILRSRYIMEQHLGRILNNKTEQIHHINNNTLDDRLENLQIVTIQEHSKIHKNRKLNYSVIEILRTLTGWGYKNIAKCLNYPPKSVQSALKVLDKEGKIHYRIK